MSWLSEQAIARKAEIVSNVVNLLKDASSLLVFDYRGLTVDQMTDLRQQLRDAGAQMRVIKNTYLKRAAKDTGYDELNELFAGPTAVVFGGADDSTAPARIVAKFAKASDEEVIQIKGGAIEGKVASIDEINTLATLPSREGLLSMLVSALQAPVRNVAYALKAVADNSDE